MGLHRKGGPVVVKIRDNFDLQARRKRLGFTQWDVAEYLGCSVPTVSLFENGKCALPGTTTRKDSRELFARALSALEQRAS